MPYTIAHAAAALPFRRFCRDRTLHLPALLLGSLSPDLGYFLGNYGMAEAAHTALGSITVCLPVGIVFLAVFYLVQRPLIWTLPSPHRHFLMNLPEMREIPIRGPMMASAALSLLIGAWSHILWDGFTHFGGWFVQHIGFLQNQYFVPGFEGFGPIPVFSILQHVSSVLGLLSIAFAYKVWSSHHRRLLPKGWWRPEYESWRYYFWALTLLLPAVYTFAMYKNDLGLGLVEAYRRGIVFNAAVVYTSMTVCFAIAASVLIYVYWGVRSSMPESDAPPSGD